MTPSPTATSDRPSPAWWVLLVLALVLGSWGLGLCVLGEWLPGVLQLVVAVCLGVWLVTLRERAVSSEEAVAAALLACLATLGLASLPDFLGHPPEPEAFAWNLLLTFGILIFLAARPLRTTVIMAGLLIPAGLAIGTFFALLPSFLWPRFGLIVAALLGVFFWTGRRMPGDGCLGIRPGWVLGVAWLAFLVVVLRSAWVSDDAYITFRTVDNFLDGHGLRYNLAERVQTYTHPLWMLLLSATSFLTGEQHYSSIALGLILSGAAVAIVLVRLSAGVLSALVGLMLLTFSRSFIDFATSGLENSLTYFLLAVFYLIYFRSPSDRPATLLRLGLVAALVLVNRMDAVLLVLPALAHVAWRMRGAGPWRVLAILGLGLLPFFAWEAFSLVYYGFPFPNTAHAKLGTSQPIAHALSTGLSYLVHNLGADPVTVLVIGIGLFLGIRRGPEHRATVAGILLSVLYVVAIGGDFMAGRFLTGPMLLAVVLLCTTGEIRPVSAGAVAIALAGLGMVLPGNPWVTDADYRNLQFPDGIADERGFYYPVTGLLRASPESPFLREPGHRVTEWIAEGERANREHPALLVKKNVGITGYLAGPDVHIVDEYALCDPLLARLPPIRDDFARPGHFLRRLPAGYLDWLASGEDRFVSRSLSRYNTLLTTITRGPLFSHERWEAIVELNLGVHDALVDRDCYTVPRPDFWRAFPEGSDDFHREMYVATFQAYYTLYDLSAERLRRIVRQFPDRAEPLVLLGTLFEYLGKPKEAETWYRTAKDRFGPRWETYLTQFREDLDRETD